MAIRINDAARNAALGAVTALIGTTGRLRIYGGSQPAGPGTAPGGATLLAEFTLSNPAFATASGGSADLDVTPALTDTGITNGTATWFRFLTGTEASGTGLGVIDGTVTATGGGGDLELNSVSISTGIDVEVTGGQLTMPASA